MQDHNDASPGGSEAGQPAEDPAPEPAAQDEPPQSIQGPFCHAKSPQDRLTITDEGARLDPEGMQWLQSAATDALTSILGKAETRPHDVRLALVGDEEMIALHKRHMNIDSTTDVLTFDLRTDQHGPLDVDIVVCVDEAKREAENRRINLPRELLLYYIHGLLHCLGYDDHDDASFAAMHAREDEILLSIGVGATFVLHRTKEEAL